MAEKSFLHKIGFLKSTPGTESKKTTSTLKGPASITSIQTPSALNTDNAQLEGTSREDIIQFLKKILADNNIPGPDYNEFITALESLKTAPLDERTKFTTIFAGFKAQNVTPGRLIETAKMYIKILDQKKQSFQSEAAQHVAEKDVAQKALIKENEKIDAQMQQLATKKLENDTQYKALGTEIQGVNQNKTDFENTCTTMVGEIERNVTLIDQYLNVAVTA